MRKNEALREGWMAIQPEGDEPRRIWVREVNLPEHLEGMRSHLFGVRHDTVDYFEAVNIGGVFFHPTEAIDER